MTLHPPGDVRSDFERLLQEARIGSREALGRLLEPFFYVLRHRAERQLRANLQAKFGGSDLMQVTLLEAQTAFSQFRGRSPEELASWLWRILCHNAQNFRRQYLECEKRQVSRELALDDSHMAGGLEEMLPAAGTSPGSELARREEEEALRRAVEQLSPPQRRVVYLHAYECRSFREVGVAVGCSEEAARKTWTRALRNLADQMRGTFGEPT